MAYYYLQNSIPSFNFTLKENIPALTGTVISSQYYFSIQDYQNLNLTINNINESISKIFSLNRFFLNEDSQLSLSALSSNIDTLIDDYYINIRQLNGVPISTSHKQNINVIEYFKINNVYYGYNEDNGGNIVLLNRYISGRPEDYVQAFNNKNGNVTGAIEKIILNNKIQPIVDGVVTLNGLVPENKMVISVDGQYDEINLFYTLKIFDDLELTADSTNQGKVIIPTHFYDNSNKLNYNIQLNNVQTTNENTAITKDFLLNQYANNNTIIKELQYNTSDNTITLDANWYPLHFYDSSGNWLPNITWSESSYLAGKHIFNIIINDNNITIRTYTIMKVD